MKKVQMIINNTCVVDAFVWDAIRAAVASGSELPPELADTFKITYLEVDGESRARIDWA